MNRVYRLLNNLKYIGWSRVLINVCILLLWNVFPLIGNYINKYLTSALISRDRGMTGGILIFQIIIWILSILLNAYDQNIRQESVTRSDTYDKLELCKKKCALSAQYFETPAGINAFSQANRGIGKRYSLFKNAVLLLMLVPTLLLSIAPVIRAAKWACCLLAIILGLNIFVSARCADIEYLESVRQLESERRRNYYKSLFYNFSLLKEIRCYGVETWLLNKYDGVSKKIFKETHRIHIRSSLITASIDVVSMFSKLLFWVYICYQAIDGVISISNCVLLIGLWDTALSAIEGFRDATIRLYHDYKGVRDMDCFLDMEEETKKESVQAVDAIVIKNLSFSYPIAKDKLILKDVSLDFYRGNCYLMLGSNGAGKSTLIKLLLSQFKVDEKAIMINGCHDINLVNGIKVGYMAQNDPHFSMTLKENIIFGSSYDDGRFKDAVQKAGITSLIESLPLKEDTLLGMAYDEGRELSGGQWQRINFARLLYNQCDIVILDEPTASMDPLAERDLYCEIKRIFQDKIIILVSHRLSSVGIADKIIFLEEGKVTGFGTHEALLSNCASYRSMIAIQEAISEGGACC